MAGWLIVRFDEAEDARSSSRRSDASRAYEILFIKIQLRRKMGGKLGEKLLRRSAFYLRRSFTLGRWLRCASLSPLSLSLVLPAHLSISCRCSLKVPGLISKSLSPAGFYKQLLEPIYTDSCRRLQYRRKSDSMKRKVREKFLNIW